MPGTRVTLLPRDAELPQVKFLVSARALRLGIPWGLGLRRKAEVEGRTWNYRRGDTELQTEVLVAVDPLEESDVWSVSS